MIQVCICDDSEATVTELTGLIASFFDENQLSCKIDTYTDSRQLLEKLKQHFKYDLYFLDIIMPEINGMTLANEIREYDEICAIVFLTSSPEYAVDSYSVKAFNYLLKPIDKNRLTTTLQDYRQKMNMPDAKEKLLIKEKGTLKLISFSQICYFEVRRNKLVIYLNTNESIEIYKTLTELEAELCDQKTFIRIHRSFIINMHYIREIAPSEVILLPNCRLPLSKNYSAALKAAYFSFAEQHFSPTH